MQTECLAVAATITAEKLEHRVSASDLKAHYHPSIKQFHDNLVHATGLHFDHKDFRALASMSREMNVLLMERHIAIASHREKHVA